jgi:hypothetical protein
MERNLETDGKTLTEASLDEMETGWQAVKATERKR